jgi:hypothetical protein
MSLELEPQEKAAAGERTAKVIAVCYSEKLKNNVGKEPKESGHVTEWGIPGDIHYGETRWSASERRIVPNNRPITVVGYEAGRDACERLGVPEIPAGGLGENFLLEGMGDLGDLVEGDKLHFIPAGESEPSVILEVRKQNEPCSNLLIYHKQMLKELMGKRGVICTVLKEGDVKVGDTVSLVREN